MSIFLKVHGHGNPLRSALKLLLFAAVPCVSLAYGSSVFTEPGSAKAQLKALLSTLPKQQSAAAVTVDAKGRYDGGQGDARTRVLRIVSQSQAKNGCIVDARFITQSGNCEFRRDWLMSTSQHNGVTQYNLSKRENGSFVTYAIIYPGQKHADGRTKVDERPDVNYPSVLGDLISG